MGNDGLSYGHVGLWYLWDIEVVRLCRIKVNSMSSGARLLGSPSPLCHLPAVQPWANSGAFLCLCFLFC